MKIYAQRLRDLRTDRELSLVEITVILGTTKNQAGKYERGQQEMPICHLITLCNYFHISADYILGLPEGRPYRVVKFTGSNGGKMILCTNLRNVSADVIAGVYKERWNIECFFRTLKQNYTIKKLFGTTANAVYTQGLVAFIAYVLLFNVHERVKNAYSKRSIWTMPQHNQIFPQFLRVLKLGSI